MAYGKRTKEDLRTLQAMPLDVKIRLAQDRIRAWVNEFGEEGVVVSFSGGKDSTVLLHLVRELYPNVKAVFSNTGLEYPEIRQFAMKHENVDMVHPDMGFVDVITQYGYPLISKEVAEAIYYARRIGGGSGKEKRLQPKSGENYGLQTSCYGPKRAILSGSLPSLEGGAEESRKRAELLGERRYKELLPNQVVKCPQSKPQPRPDRPEPTRCLLEQASGGALRNKISGKLVHVRTRKAKEARTQRIQARGESADGEYF